MGEVFRVKFNEGGKALFPRMLIIDPHMARVRLKAPSRRGCVHPYHLITRRAVVHVSHYEQCPSVRSLGRSCPVASHLSLDGSHLCDGEDMIVNVVDDETRVQPFEHKLIPCQSIHVLAFKWLNSAKNSPVHKKERHCDGRCPALCSHGQKTPRSAGFTRADVEHIVILTFATNLMDVSLDSM